MVVYKRLLTDNQILCRPYEMFISEVDIDKYPNVKQKYRMEIKDFIILNEDKMATLLNLLRLSISTITKEKTNNETI